ncbi:hypothetical protein CXB51_021745 [Gossypium anomalum]|uniref:Uncharacterized protein n=1 Tax=Gossypium anomalum TaxID=47600 RepID=A0A8J5YLY3_9ROSI|nr:hypothetical protein CXB51_021745 [Gossypium anomalum]
MGKKVFPFFIRKGIDRPLCSSTFPESTPRWPTSQISRRRGSVAWSSARFGSLARVVLCLGLRLAAPISFCC